MTAKSCAVPPLSHPTPTLTHLSFFLKPEHVSKLKLRIEEHKLENDSLKRILFETESKLRSCQSEASLIRSKSEADASRLSEANELNQELHSCLHEIKDQASTKKLSL